MKSTPIEMRKALLLLCLWTAGAAATRVHHRSLEEVLTPQVQVVSARVASSQVSIEPDLLRITVAIDRVEPLRLSTPPPQQVEHSFSTRLERRDGQGNTVRVSPVRDGSGWEHRLEVGQRYLMLLDLSGKRFIRVEPLASEPRVREILKSQL